MNRHKNDIINKIEQRGYAALPELYAQYSNWLGVAAEELSEDYDELLEAVSLIEKMIAAEFMKQHGYCRSYLQDFNPWVKEN